MEVYLLIRRGPEWSKVIGVYLHENAARAEAKRLNIAARHSKDVFESLSSYEVEPKEVIG